MQGFAALQSTDKYMVAWGSATIDCGLAKDAKSLGPAYGGEGRRGGGGEEVFGRRGATKTVVVCN
jgi:hypothetical protein